MDYSRNTACKANIFPFYLTQAAKSYVAASHSVVRLETIEISEQRTAFIWIFAQEVDWCIKDCDKERLQTTAFINVWKIFPGYTGDWFDVKTASTCTTELWDALKSFILDSLKIKVAPHPIIVSLDTLTSTQRLSFFPGPFFAHAITYRSTSTTNCMQIRPRMHARANGFSKNANKILLELKLCRIDRTVTDNRLCLCHSGRGAWSRLPWMTWDRLSVCSHNLTINCHQMAERRVGHFVFF